MLGCPEWAAFCLNDDFSPYWKWTAACFRQIPWVAPIARELDALNASNSVEDGTMQIESICKAVRERLVISGFVPEGRADDWGHAVIKAEIQRLEESRRGIS